MAGEDSVGPSPLTEFVANLADVEGATEIVFVREGREHTMRVPLSAPFEIVAPSAITKGDKVTIDLAPRPAFDEGVRVDLALNNLRASGVVLPIVVDTATLESTAPASTRNEPGVLYVTVIADKAPSGSGDSSVGRTSFITSRIATRRVALQL